MMANQTTINPTARKARQDTETTTMTTTTRTKISATSDRTCTIRYEDLETGLVVTREFVAPTGGGYVREWVNGGRDTRQACDRLASFGPTLRWDGRQPLVHLIRAEYRAMRRAERALARRDGWR